MPSNIDQIFSLERNLKVVSLDELGKPYVLSPAIFDFLLTVFYGMFQERPFHAKEIIELMTKRGSFFFSGAIENVGNKYAQSRFLSELVKNGSSKNSYQFVYSVQSSDFCKKIGIKNNIPNSTGKELLYFLSGEGYVALEILLHLPWGFFQHTNIYFQQSLKNNKQVPISKLQNRAIELVNLPERFYLHKRKDLTSFIWQDLRKEVDYLLNSNFELFYQVFSKEFQHFREVELLQKLLSKNIQNSDEKTDFLYHLSPSIKNKNKLQKNNVNSSYGNENRQEIRDIFERYKEKKDYFLKLI